MMIMLVFSNGFRLMPGRRQQENHRGFTLLEVLVAISIIAIVLVSALRLQGQSVTMGETAIFYATAPFLAQKKMSEARFEPHRFSGGESGHFENAPRELEWRVAVETVDMGDQGSELSLLLATVTIYSPILKTSYVLHDFFHADAGERPY